MFKHSAPILIAISLICLFGLLFGWAASPEQVVGSPSDKKMIPDLVFLGGSERKQGSILHAQVKANGRALGDLTAEWGGIRGKFFEQSSPSEKDSTEALSKASEQPVYELVMGIPVDLKPGKYPFVVRNTSGDEIAREIITVLDGKFRRQNITVSKSTKGLSPLPGELEAIQALKKSLTPVRYWSKPLISPTIDCENSPFGVKRYHNGVYTQDYHKGVDLRSPSGRPIKAVADGIVRIAEPRFRLHGGTVGLDHGQGLSSIYIHMSKVAAKAGDRVKKGDIIGYVGATGFATGPHLHWGLYANGVPVNPDDWIPVPRC